MAEMIAPVLMLAGTAMTAFGQIQEGKAANDAAKFEARQLEQRAKAEEAAGQHKALESRRQSQLLQSRALAAAGASGAGTLDPGVLSMISGLSGEGERAFQSDMFEAKTAANIDRSEAMAARRRGEMAKRASQTAAFSTALSGLGGAAGAMNFGQPAGGGGGFKPPIPQRKPVR